jgi:uncharacterized protein (DUF305 family)
MRFRYVAFIVALTSSAMLTACGSSAEPNAAAFNDADVSFAQNMIPHHQQAVEMADIALKVSSGASIEVADLAKRIQGAQQPEIDVMSGWLKTWGKESAPTTEMADMEGMDHSSMSGMEGMMSAEEMASLQSATGLAFDTAWMQMMVRHHEGAVAMAKQVQGAGSNAEVKALAAKIIVAQEAEISEMKATLDK